MEWKQNIMTSNNTSHIHNRLLDLHITPITSNHALEEFVFDKDLNLDPKMMLPIAIKALLAPTSIHIRNK
jgi:hypothetical protein